LYISTHFWVPLINLLTKNSYYPVSLGDSFVPMCSWCNFDTDWVCHILWQTAYHFEPIKCLVWYDFNRFFSGTGSGEVNQLQGNRLHHL